MGMDKRTRGKNMMIKKYGWFILPFLLIIYVYSFVKIAYYIDDTLKTNPYPYGISTFSFMSISFGTSILLLIYLEITRLIFPIRELEARV